MIKIRPASDHKRWHEVEDIAGKGNFLQYVKNWQDADAVLNGCVVDTTLGERVVSFIEMLKQSKGKWGGHRIQLMDWQKYQVIIPLFSWIKANGLRRFNRAYIEIPKKNGKSTLCAGLANYFLLADPEPGAEVYGAGTDRDQAGIVFREAASMLRKSELAGVVKIIDSTKTITYGDSMYHALAADADSSEGKNIHALIFDELHAQRNRAFFDSLIYGGAARTQPMLISITTAGYNRESICWEEREVARQVLEGISDIAVPHIFAYISCADENDDWTSEETWKKANPSYGLIIDPEEMKAACDTAKLSPAKVNRFKRYRLNIWTHGEERAVEPEAWRACAAEFDEKDLLGRECYGGLDLAKKHDLAALVLTFPPVKKDEAIKQLAYAWCPKEKIMDRTYKNGVNYETWVDQGWLRATHGETIDYEAIEITIGKELREKFNIKIIGYDRWGSWEAVPRMEKDYQLVFQPFGQGYASMSGPTSDWIRHITQKRIAHNGNPVFEWNVCNLILQEDAAGNIKPDKEASKEKIDVAVASIMSLGICLKEFSQSQEEIINAILGGIRT